MPGVEIKIDVREISFLAAWICDIGFDYKVILYIILKCETFFLLMMGREISFNNSFSTLLNLNNDLYS